MTNLEFNLKGSKFVAEFAATGDFNLHVEREGSGAIYVQAKSTIDGEYDSIRGFNISDADKVVDTDFTALVYPKYIKIVSEVQPKVAVVTYTSDTQEAIDASIVSIINNPV